MYLIVKYLKTQKPQKLYFAFHTKYNHLDYIRHTKILKLYILVYICHLQQHFVYRLFAQIEHYGLLTDYMVWAVWLFVKHTCIIYFLLHCLF